MFDCVLPTRSGRHAHVYTFGEGRLNLKNARFRTDRNPVEEDCPCMACGRYSRAYLHHLIKNKEETGKRLLTLHNLMHYRRLMAGAREAILQGTFAAYRISYRDRNGNKE